MRRAALLVALLALPAAAYIPSVGSIFKRAALKTDQVDRSREVTLRGMVKVGEAAGSGVAVPVERAIARPKSRIFRCPSSVSFRLAGFRSR